MRNIVKTLIITGTAATVMTMAAAPASAKICKDYIHGGFGQGPESVALAYARTSWSNSVTAVHGAEWASWSIARTKKSSCITTDASLKLKACTVKASPCMLERGRRYR